MTRENERLSVAYVRKVATGWLAFVAKWAVAAIPVTVFAMSLFPTSNDADDYNRGVEAGQQYAHEVFAVQLGVAGTIQAAQRPGGNRAFEAGVADGIAWQEAYDRRFDDCKPEWYPSCAQPQPPPPSR
jgi:hypothetical protein